MNDPIFVTPTGRIFRTQYQDGAGFNNWVLHKNITGVYEWRGIDGSEMPTDVTESTLDKAGFRVAGDAIMKKSVNPIRTTENMDFITNERGGFTVAQDPEDPFVYSTHQAVRTFDNWTPDNAQQRRFKEMVQKIEEKAMNEEDEHHFNQGSAVDDFKNPI